MVTNDVRVILADYMRRFDVVSDAAGRYWLNGTLFGMDISARSEETVRNGMRRLAGLIEPDEGHFAEGDKMVDRDALLKLADKMESQQYMREDARLLRWDVAARRIRETLGEDK